MSPGARSSGAPAHRPGTPDGGAASTSKSRLSVALVAVALLAAVPRLLGIFDALWLDEIWSIRLAAGVDSAWQVVSGIHHDNNHYLNTLWLLLLGPDVPGALYRLPAFIAGVATVYLAGWSELEAGSRPALLAATLLGVSYPFVHYASEARGYALVAFLALAAFVALRRHHRTGGVRSGALFALVASLGFLAHLTFVTVFLPLLGWSLRVSLARRNRGRRGLTVLAVHLAPVAVLVGLVFFDIRHLVRGGAPARPPLAGWLEAWALTAGLPSTGWAGLVAGAALLVVVVPGFRAWTRAAEGAGVFFALVLLVPLLVLLAFGGGYGPPRYFLASLPFGILLLARGLDALLGRGGAPRAFAALLLTVALVGNGSRVARFLDVGRGSYEEAVGYMAAHTRGDTIRVASDLDFGSAMVLDYYRRFLPQDVALDYVSGSEPSPEWYLVHAFEDAFAPARDLPPGGALDPPFELQAVFRKYGLSGWHWAVYRRSES